MKAEVEVVSLISQRTPEIVSNPPEGKEETKD
jgi:hypothetical protein